MTENNKDERIKKEADRLNNQLKNLDEETLTSIQPIIDNAAFMAVTLEDLRAEINEEGVTEEYQNGPNQWGFKERTAVKVYNTMIKNYHANMRQLQPYIERAEAEEDDGFEMFLAQRHG